ncbi:MAG: Kelch repeat-containing protein [Planctomycetota bacterium]
MFSPAIRQEAALARSGPGDSKFVLFGGIDTSSAIPPIWFADTWIYDGGDMSWTEVFPPTSPSPRWGHVMAYDSDRERVILFGGRSELNTALGDCWEFDGLNWTQLFFDESPAPRAEAGMVYDPQRNTVVLHGGSDGAPIPMVIHEDTWSLGGDPLRWSLESPAQSGPAVFAPFMSYDELAQRVLLYGGLEENPAGPGFGIPRGGMWEWDGSGWTRLTTQNSPGPLGNAQGAYHAGLNRTLVFSGLGPVGRTSDTYLFDYSTKEWTRSVTNMTPIKRIGAAAAYDPERARILMHAGKAITGELGDTWEFGRGVATAADYGSACAGAGQSPRLSRVGGSVPVSGRLYEIRVENLDPEVDSVLLLIGFSVTRFGPFDLPIDLGPLGFSNLAGCKILTSCEYCRSFAVDGKSSIDLSIQIPGDAGLLGRHFFCQAIGLDAGFAIQGLTQGLRNVVGS